MLPYLRSAHGNASSLHQSGRFLRSAIEQARQQVADLVDAEPAQVIFTSGGTEANNLAVKGFVSSTSDCRLMCSAVEHASVLEPMQQMTRRGCGVDYMAVDATGVVDSADAQRLIDQRRPHLVSLQLANNETGAIQPIQQLAPAVHAVGALYHSDVTQAVGRIPVAMPELGVDLLTLSGHKIQGPQGTGALVMGGRAELTNPLISGGAQEKSRRAGTENAALLVGLGRAAELARNNLSARASYLLELRRYFERQLLELDGAVIFASDVERLPNTSFFSIPYYHGETLLMQLDQAGFELASGSACHSEVTAPSHVLQAMGVDENIALNAVRVSFGMDNTRAEVDRLISQINTLINQLPAFVRQAAG